MRAGPLALLEMDQTGVLLPPSAWPNEHLAATLAELVSTNYVGDELPPPIDGPEGAPRALLRPPPAVGSACRH